MIPPGSTIGILGGGQLGRMLAIAAAELGYHVHIYCPEQNCPASEVARFTTVAAYEDMEALKRFGQSVDIVTYEFENIPAAPVAELAQYVPVRPDPAILALSQHRVVEKQVINELGIVTASFQPVGTLDELAAALQVIGLPAVLKTAMMGYDGKGQVMLKTPEDMEKLTDNGFSTDLILESFIPFSMEISVIVARDLQGNMECYCPVQNIHRQHILAETIVPAPIHPVLAEKAEAIACIIADGLDLIGLMAVEMFVTPPLLSSAGSEDEWGVIVVNELAPRPHNSGHWTIDACITSQFEQTIRAICGLPLGSTQRLCDATMFNLIGDDVLEWERYAAMLDARLHLYGKKDIRPGRKMGHVTILFPEDNP